MSQHNSPPERDVTGRWLPGRSGNPGGRPAGRGRVQALAAGHTEEAIAMLARLMRGGASDDVRLRAAVALLDRAWGRPAQAVTGEDGGPVALLPVRSMEEAVRIANEAVAQAVLPPVCIDAHSTED